jgi:hypothetical protein
VEWCGEWERPGSAFYSGGQLGWVRWAASSSNARARADIGAVARADVIGHASPRGRVLERSLGLDRLVSTAPRLGARHGDYERALGIGRSDG